MLSRAAIIVAYKRKNRCLPPLPVTRSDVEPWEQRDENDDAPEINPRTAGKQRGPSERREHRHGSAPNFDSRQEEYA